MKAKKVLKKKKKETTSRFVSDNSRLSIGIVFVSLQNLGRLENSKSPRYLPGIFPKGFPLEFSPGIFLWNCPKRRFSEIFPAMETRETSFLT